MKKSRKLVLALLVVFLIVSMTACGSSDGAKTESIMDYNTSAGSDLYYEDGYDGEWEESIEKDTGSVTDNRKLIKTVDLTAETYEFDQLVSTIEKKVRTLGGYMESSSVSTNWNDLKCGDFTIRVPADELDRFVSEFAEISNITNKSTDQKDVTLSYVDMESHKAALEAEETSLLKLLENAQSIEDIIALQSRLTEVRYQIESMESQLRTMDNLVDYATIYLYIEEVETYTPVEEPSMGEQISRGLKDSLDDIGRGFKNFVIYVVVNSPYLLIWGVVIAVVIIVLRTIIKAAIKRGEENEVKRQKEMQAKMVQEARMAQNSEQNGQGNGKQ